MELEDPPRASDRTTSPLQIGHVRRRVVSHGVLGFVSCNSGVVRVDKNLHAVDVELVAAGQTHNPAYAIDIFLKTYHALYLPTHVLFPVALLLVFAARFGRF